MPGMAQQGHVQGQEVAGFVKTHGPIKLKAMAAPGDEHVVIAVWAQLHGPAQPRCGQARHAGKQGRLRLFAAKATAHAAALHLHLVLRPGQGMGHQGLHLAGVLGGAPNLQAAVVLRCGIGDLPFQIKLLLPAQAELATEPVRRLRHRTGHTGARRTAGQAHGRHHMLCRRMGLAQREARGQGLVLDDFGGEGRRAACGLTCVGHHRKHRLAQVAQLALGQDRVVMHDGAAVIGARDVPSGEHRHHPRQGFECSHINAQQAAMGHGREA